MRRYWIALALGMLAGCDGIGGKAAPPVPDPSIAVSFNDGIETTNAANFGFDAPAWQYKALPLSQFFAQGGDRRVYWGDYQRRFVMAGIHCFDADCGMGVDIAMTPGVDPFTQGWQSYRWGSDRVVDQPSVGLAQNICMVADREGGIWANTVTNMQLGQGANPWFFAQAGFGGYAAHSRDGDRPFSYVLSRNANSNSIFIQRFDASLAQQQIKIGTGGYTISLIREGGDLLGDESGEPVPGSATNAVTDAFVAAGGHHLLAAVSVQIGGDDCVRVFDFYDVGAGTFAPTLQGHADFCDPGGDTWAGALGQTLTGEVYVLMGCSGPSRPVSMCLGHWTGPQARTQLVSVVQQGTAFGTVASRHRLGDFTTLATWYRDPTKLLAAGQIAKTTPTQWFTWIDLIP